MRTVGIIAEYNPFHTGHAYHLSKAKEETGADYALAVMSPDFVQRGEPAVFDKYTRTKMALLGGADAVFELPVCYASGSAEYFARGAVALLDGLGVVDTLCFGSESDDLPLFQQTAALLQNEPPEYQKDLQAFLKSGMTYPLARCEALCRRLDNDMQAERLRVFLSSPNNILGVEYCRALLRAKSAIRPVPVLRQGSSYNSRSLSGPYCSASALRHGLQRGAAIPLPDSALLHYVPENCRELFTAACADARCAEDFLPCLAMKLLTADSFGQILDVGPELSDRLLRLRCQCIGKSWTEIIALLKTKQLTEARIRRALLHLLLDIRTEQVQTYLSGGTVFYARLLGFRESAAPLLHKIKQKSTLPLIVKNTRASSMLSGSALQMWEQDIRTSHLYRGVPAAQHHTDFRTEYEMSPIVV